jgi:hypothetical protein
MTKPIFEDVIGSDGEIVSMAIIDNGDGTVTSMTKAHYEELQAAAKNVAE